MKRHPASLPLAAAALAFTLAACGSHHQEAGQPAPGSTAQLPPQPPYTAAQPAPPATAEQPMGAGSAGMPASNGTGATAQTPGFEQLAGNKGYITQQDAQRVPWLSQHFAQCDANGDGRITRDEYSRCRQGPAQSTMQQPPALPPQGGSSSG